MSKVIRCDRCGEETTYGTRILNHDDTHPDEGPVTWDLCELCDVSLSKWFHHGQQNLVGDMTDVCPSCGCVHQHYPKCQVLNHG